MPSIDRTIDVQQPARRVWDFMYDFRNTEAWDPPTVRTVRESGDGGVGTVYQNTSKILGRDVDITYTVIECDPGRLLKLRGETSSMTAIDTIEVSGDDTSARLRYHAEFEMNGAAKLVEPLMPLGLKKLGDDAEQSIRECLENM
jgi:hypothetical protein